MAPWLSRDCSCRGFKIQFLTSMLRGSQPATTYNCSSNKTNALFRDICFCTDIGTNRKREGKEEGERERVRKKSLIKIK